MCWWFGDEDDEVSSSSSSSKSNCEEVLDRPDDDEADGDRFRGPEDEAVDVADNGERFCSGMDVVLLGPNSMTSTFKGKDSSVRSLKGQPANDQK